MGFVHMSFYGSHDYQDYQQEINTRINARMDDITSQSPLKTPALNQYVYNFGETVTGSSIAPGTAGYYCPYGIPYTSFGPYYVPRLTTGSYQQDYSAVSSACTMSVHKCAMGVVSSLPCLLNDLCTIRCTLSSCIIVGT